MGSPLVVKALLEAPATVGDLERQLESVCARAGAAGAVRSGLSVDDFRRLVCGIEFAAHAGLTVNRCLAVS